MISSGDIISGLKNQNRRGADYGNQKGSYTNRKFLCSWMAFPADIYSYEYISRDILTELKKANWTSFVLGIVLVGLEVGFIYAYKAGWKVSAAQIVTSSILGVILIIVGYVGYKEAITWNKIVGVIVCLAGLGLINLK